MVFMRLMSGIPIYAIGRAAEAAPNQKTFSRGVYRRDVAAFAVQSLDPVPRVETKRRLPSAFGCRRKNAGKRPDGSQNRRSYIAPKRCELRRAGVDSVLLTPREGPYPKFRQNP